MSNKQNLKQALDNIRGDLSPLRKDGNLYDELVDLRTDERRTGISKLEYATFIEAGQVKFHVGVQGFTLDYKGDEDDLSASLEWMRQMLQDAIDNLAKGEQG